MGHRRGHGCASPGSKPVSTSQLFSSSSEKTQPFAVVSAMFTAKSALKAGAVCVRSVMRSRMKMRPPGFSARWARARMSRIWSGLSMERAEDRHGVVGRGLVLVGVVVARAAFDTVREPRLGNAVPRDGAHGGHVHGHAREAGIRLDDQFRIGGGAAREVEEARAAGEVEHRHDAAPDRAGAPAHRKGEPPRPGGVVAEVELRRLDGFARADKLREASPGRIDVLVVADGLGEIGGAAGHERELARLRVEVGLLLLAEKPLGDAGVEEEAQGARRGLRLRREGRQSAEPPNAASALKTPTSRAAKRTALP